MNVKNALLQLHQRPIAYYPIYRKLTGSTTAGILLSQLMYWFSACNGREFYKTDAEIIEETLLTAGELRTAKAKIKKLPFVKIRVKGVPARTFYFIDLQNLFSEIDKASIAESTKLDSLNQQNSVSEINETITENTQENTTENTQEEPSGFSPPYEIIEKEIDFEPLPNAAKHPQKEKEKSSAKKEKEPSEEYQLLETFKEYHAELYPDNLYTHQQKDFRHLKLLKGHLADRIARQHGIEKGEVEFSEVLENFRVFLQCVIELKDRWYLDNFTPPILNSKFQELTNKISNERKKRKQSVKPWEFLEQYLSAFAVESSMA